MKIIYMGTPDFAVYPLRKLIESEHDVVCVVSQPDAVRDRGKKLKATPVKEVAQEHSIPVLQPSKIKDNAEFLDALAEYEADLIVVAAYGKILPREIIDMGKYGCVNIHGSLLPRWRGAAPIQRAIMAGDEETGVTLMYVAQGLDTGNMIAKRTTKTQGKNANEMFDEISKMGGDLLVENMQNIFDGVKGEVQDDSLATYAPMLSKEDGLLDFSKTAAQLDAQIRGVSLWPGAYTYRDGEIFKVWQAEIGNTDFKSDEAGRIISISNKGIEVSTGCGSLMLKVIQTPNKRRMSAEEFLRGNKLEIGSLLGR